MRAGRTELVACLFPSFAAAVEVVDGVRAGPNGVGFAPTTGGAGRVPTSTSIEGLVETAGLLGAETGVGAGAGETERPCVAGGEGYCEVGEVVCVEVMMA